MMLETWLQLGLQLYLIYYYYYGVRLASLSQRLSLYKSIFILVPLSLKALMPEDTFTKNPQETWIIAIKRMVWITFLWLTMLITSIYTPAVCIGNLRRKLEEPLCIWILSSSVFICLVFIIMSFRKSGYGRLKCYMLCVLFLQFGIYWTFAIISNNLQLKSFKSFIIDISDELAFTITSTFIVVIFAKAANSIKNLHGNIRFTQENPDYMLLDDFEMISRVVTSIGLKSTSKLPNMYFCSLIMMPLLLLIGFIIPNL